MVIKSAVLLILIDKAEEYFTDHPQLHYVVVSGKDAIANHIPSLCKSVALSYLKKHPEYRLAYSESWEYLAESLTIDEEREE